MLSTMQDEPLSLATLLKYAATFQGESTVSTWTGDGVRTMTYRELGAEAARLANALSGLGIGVGDRVGTFMWNNNEHMVAYIGVPAMGAVLHALNIRLFPEQLVYVANHAEDKVVIVDGSLVPMFAQLLPNMKTVRHVIVANGDAATLQAPEGVQVHSYSELLAGQSDSYDFPVIDERSAAAMCYTSGTTGDPKGVVYSHRSNWLHAMQVVSPSGMGFSGADRVLAIVPLFHANAWGIPYAALMSGANVVMPDRFLQPGPLLEILANLKPTFAAAVPTIWGGVLAALAAQPQDISHLRTVVVGGAAVPPSMMHAFQERHGVRVLHAWGMTETSPLGSVAHAPAGVTGEEEWAYRYTQGRFPASVQARLVDDAGNVVPNDGESLGELEVKGPWITGSYYSPDGSPVDPDKFDNGWLRTGDVGKISPDGYLTLVDRSKDVIKSGGEWISSVDLENAVMGHPAVAEAAVIGVPDEKWDERPLVAIVLAEGATAEPTELRDFLADKFAKWQLPEHWTFISEVPKTSVGKFDKKQLRAQYANGELDVKTLA
ncbi:long-chain fatty acid--CoA ligase [Nocardia farcinica]|uniref:long-chain fatty acid--CoA ligase n=1 Tax=Nocardia farcinica TaxID=37329 RepID=UPI001893975B|nr:long-chain fatty acid--CoA ligase [Nocardia farcinica]MBF6262863.1 long-chain fatty acid--CoA ligase [Nocardia farcinica]MBF6281367.1 long-chain fatty acid--CoA ligase [Nocardia farcinica]MBF6305837.1 long-chain fatty acid--CoA ligase [Nocardia farcinica]MBF6389935.1 long-chain fatty acid--CoA ligase [Nocardia farcinica]MBF6491318.1 long-chain fatty acid--CoA ligase [Nocardia farcinica]